MSSHNSRTRMLWLRLSFCICLKALSAMANTCGKSSPYILVVRKT